MPRYIDTRERSALEKYKRELINKDLLRCYQQLVKDEDVTLLIRTHKKFINRLELVGNKKLPTLHLLEHYKNTENKALALSILTNSLNNNMIIDNLSCNCNPLTILLAYIFKK